MKRKLLILFFTLSIGVANSQEIGINVGTNFTSYKLKNPETFMGTPLQSGSGSSYEIAYSSSTGSRKLFYDLGLGINDYNALAGTLTNSYKWNTKSVGFRVGLEYELFKADKIQLMPDLGVVFSHIIYGKQEINGALYDISNNPEFSGVRLVPYLGLNAKYKIKDYGYVSLGYNHSVSFKPTLINKEYLTMATNQIVFGLHFNVK